MKLNDPTLLRPQCLIGGEWTGAPVDPVDNPATGEVIASVPRFGAAEAEKAVSAAHAAFGPWSKKTAKERSALLRKWFDLLMANKDDIALIMTSEQGKPLAEAKGEVEYAAGFIEFYAEEAKRVYGETLPSPRTDSRRGISPQP